MERKLRLKYELQRINSNLCFFFFKVNVYIWKLLHATGNRLEMTTAAQTAVSFNNMVSLISSASINMCPHSAGDLQ